MVIVVSEDETIWRYVYLSRVRHAMRSPASQSARCHYGPAWHSRWLGATAQEHDHCMTLRVCRRCQELLDRE